jgi:hypothetical protein
MQREPWSGWPAAATAFFCGVSGSFGASRVAYEALFPRAIWLGQPAAVMLLALVGGGAALWAWRRLAIRAGKVAALTPLLPLLLPLTIVTGQAVQLAQSRFLVVLALWLSLLLLLRLFAEHRRLFALLLAILVGGVYLLTLGQHVGRADSFEFQVTVPRLGIAHPTGYPLFLLASKPFTWLPWGTVAARVNLATALFGVLAVVLLFALTRQLGGRRIPAVLAALAFAFAPTFWSQAVEAEVYTLHNLIVAAALLLMVDLLRAPALERRRLLALAALLGLGLANHLTTLLLLPAAGLTLMFTAWRQHWDRRQWLRLLPRLLLAGALPLLLYLYLPLRWAAVNGEPMGLARFVDWVVGGRFQGALQLRAWLDDPARYTVVARLLLAEWQPAWPLVVALLGFIWLVQRQWRVALILLLTWLAFVFYALNYYVPDLNVFLLPAQLLLVLWWGLGLAALWSWLARRSGLLPATAVALLLAAPLFVSAAGRWTQVDRSQPDKRVEWAGGVLAQSLPQGAAILADSESFPPLYYLQQAEGLRPDLYITVLPDEAAYRAALGARLAAGQPVYLARFLPNLEGQYHLRSAGPLLEVGTAPWEALPAGSVRSELSFGPVQLRGYQLEPEAAVDADATALTLYWQAEEAIPEPLYVYIRWAGAGMTSQPIPPAGQHPAGNYYPTVAWKPGEFVSDFHLLPRPVVTATRHLEIQVALAPPFAPDSTLDWQTVAALPVAPPAQLAGSQPLRVSLGNHYLHGVMLPAQVRPGESIPVYLEGSSAAGAGRGLALQLLPAGETPQPGNCTRRLQPSGELASAIWAESLETPAMTGRYRLWAVTRDCGESAAAPVSLCSWLAPGAGACPLARLEVSGVALPEGATNFGDRIALLDVAAGETTLRPGALLPVTLTWQGLAPLAEDYTVFVQVVDVQDRIVGQVDSWPLQGTYPTSQWRPGEVIRDPYSIRLEDPLPAGNYRLLVGWYLLATGQRLPVLDETGAPIEDKVVLPGLVVPE